MDYQKYLSYYRKYGPIVYGLGLKMLGGEAAATEVLEHVFVRIASQESQLPSDKEETPQILRIAYSCIQEKLGKLPPHPGVHPGIIGNMQQPSGK